MAFGYKPNGLLRNGSNPDKPATTAAPASPATPAVPTTPTTPAATVPPAMPPASALTVPDYSVATKVGEITSKNSPLMQQAQTAGMQFANKRGLLNSSLAGEAAQEAVIKTATPIASQDSSQEHALQLAGMNLAANAQDKVSAAAASIEQIYSNSFSNIMNNESIPKTVRDQLVTHIGKLRDSSMALLEQIYGVQLTWASPA